MRKFSHKSGNLSQFSWHVGFEWICEFLDMIIFKDVNAIWTIDHMNLVWVTTRKQERIIPIPLEIISTQSYDLLIMARRRGRRGPSAGEGDEKMFYALMAWPGRGMLVRNWPLTIGLEGAIRSQSSGRAEAQARAWKMTSVLTVFDNFGTAGKWPVATVCGGGPLGRGLATRSHVATPIDSHIFGEVRE